MNGRGRYVDGIENCSCPAGYTGMSCETCDYGYVKQIDPFSSNVACKKCNCHNHSPACDQTTNNCSVLYTCRPVIRVSKTEIPPVGVYRRANTTRPGRSVTSARPVSTGTPWTVRRTIAKDARARWRWTRTISAPAAGGRTTWTATCAPNVPRDTRAPVAKCTRRLIVRSSIRVDCVTLFVA